VDPGCVAAACRHRRNASILLECLSGSVAVALFATGDEEAGGQDGPSAWQGVKSGEVGMALGALRGGVVEGLERMQGHTQLGDKSLDEERIGCNEAFSGGQWCSALDGTDASVDDVGVAHVMVVEMVLLSLGATSQLCSVSRKAGLSTYKGMEPTR
jgi:hypothetical protein